jgi:type III secretion system FlhB-like substrate exporter
MEGVEITDEMIAEMAKAYGISISEALDIVDEMRKADPKAGTSRSYPVTGGGY